MFTSDEGVGDARSRTRVTIEPAGDQAFTLFSENAAGSGPWRQSAKIVYRRVAQ